jgi:hypothetical protein
MISSACSIIVMRRRRLIPSFQFTEEATARQQAARVWIQPSSLKAL